MSRSNDLEWYNGFTSWSTHRGVLHPDPDATPIKRVHYRHSRGRGTLAALLDFLVEEVGPNFNPEDITLCPGIVIWETDPTEQELSDLRERLIKDEAKAREGRYRAYLKFKEEFEDKPLIVDFDTLIIHEPGCEWETGPYCTCGRDPERAKPASGHALGEMKRG